MRNARTAIQLIERALRALELVLEWMVALLVLLLLLIVFGQFVDRHFISLHIAAPDQYARVALVWLTFIGFAIAVRNGLNIRVDLIDARLPRKAQKALEIVFDAIMLFLLGVLMIHGRRVVEVGEGQVLLGTVLTAAQQSASLVVACAVMTLFVGLRLVARVFGVELPKRAEF
ncbi:MAG TPA: TRAP transporter small permease subunit [Steroidobacteraceae bacterium]|nr:TRAP transporter small permease subunit [Steroidobacteraceae bacterium]